MNELNKKWNPHTQQNRDLIHDDNNVGWWCGSLACGYMTHKKHKHSICVYPMEKKDTTYIKEWN